MKLAVIAGLLMGCVAGASAQFFPDGWTGECLDLNDEDGGWYSDDYGVLGPVQNDFIGVVMGISGSVTYGGTPADDNVFVVPCVVPGLTLDSRGRFAFFNGATGSIQTDFDDNLALTMGAPSDPVADFTYAELVRFADPTDADKVVPLIGDTLAGFFIGVSRRYMVAFFVDDTNEVELRASVIGDAVRMRWRLTNGGAEPQIMSLKWGTTPTMATGISSETGQRNVDPTGAIISGAFVGSNSIVNGNSSVKQAFVNIPRGKPVITERNYLRTSPSFPDFVDVAFGQEAYYGTRWQNVPTDSLPDATRVVQFLVGNYGWAQEPDLLQDTPIGTRTFDDFGTGDPILDVNPDPVLEFSDIGLDQLAIAQVFELQTVQPGASRDVVFYVRSPWSVGDYTDPYTALIDAPRLIASDFDGTNELSPNPAQIRAYVDNQYADIDREVPLTNVRFTIDLPENGGLRLADGESRVKTIPLIAPNAIGNVTWDIEADGLEYGDLPYTVTIEPIPGPKKTLEGFVRVSAAPRLRLGQGPSLIAFPWEFADTSLESVFGLTYGLDYLAYRWEPTSEEYVPATSAVRGQSLWMVPVGDLDIAEIFGANTPGDTATGGLSYALMPGWNMIGNPYPYAVQIGQLVAVSQDNPQQAFPWTDLVSSGLVGGSFAFWERNPEDPLSGQYNYTQGTEDVLLPNRGYWVYVNAAQPIRVIWPEVLVPGLPGALRSKADTAWKQTNDQWRLQLSARTDKGVDSNNFVGVATAKAQVNALRIPEPPIAPGDASDVTLAIEQVVDGKPTRLAQAFQEGTGRKEWQVRVTHRSAGEVTVTWPNIGTIPRNTRIQLKDEATGQTRDLRYSSGYTFRADEAGSRLFTLQIEQGVASRAVIGNVVVTRPSRDPAAPFTINYTLSNSANTTIRVLGGNGKEVFTIARGRADRSGENTATWALRDNANRAVAPGTYRVEILAETDGGERVRKIVPINVVR